MRGEIKGYETIKKVVFASSRIQRLEHLVTPYLAVLIPSSTSLSPHLECRLRRAKPPLGRLAFNSFIFLFRGNVND
jgi:hypothetical protein